MRNINKQEIIDKHCFSELVYERINKKLSEKLSKKEIEIFILKILEETPEKYFEIRGKNYYISSLKYNTQLTININSFRIITATKIPLKTMKSQDQKILSMTFASIYPLHLAKVERKGRTEQELQQIIEWLTGYDTKKQQELITSKVTFEEFFNEATLNPNAELITGSVCGVKIQEIENPMTKQVRYLDKLVDELAKGKELTKIMR